MRKALVFLAVLFPAICWGQDITGSWSGKLEVQDNVSLRLMFHISQSDGKYAATMDSPDQGAKGIPCSSVSFDGANLRLAIASIGMQYTGRLADGVINGKFRQGLTLLPLNLERSVAEAKPNRPQEPQRPFPYREVEIKFTNETDKITLAGTLTLPEKEGVYPAVVLISGSGAQNRDEELMEHKPFLVLSDYLTRCGIAVLRYDDRGTAHSTGDFATGTTADFARDAETAVNYLRSRSDIGKIGLIGHSEGGVIAPMVAVCNENVAFIVMLAGTGIRGDKLLLLQQELIGRAQGANEEALRRSYEENKKLFDRVVASAKPDTLGTGLSPWMLYFLKYDPAPMLEKVSCPVLALNGGKDLQVPADVNLAAIRVALTHNKWATIVELPGLNHLFQECATGSPLEYASIEQTFSPAALDVIVNWIKNINH